MLFLAVFESHFGHFVCKMGQNGPFWWVQNEFFLGPTPTQGPMNIVFEQNKLLGQKNIFGPPGPPTEKFFGPGRAGGQPKGGQNCSVGVSNPSKTVGQPQGKC